MRVCVDTNVLLRALVRDDRRQASTADEFLKSSFIVAVGITCLCEFAWVLRSGYEFSSKEIADAIRLLVEAKNVVVNRQAVEAGLAILDSGGDFADGVIAHEGAWLGGEAFVSFDKKAVKLLQTRGVQARLLS